jgi:hypothetical protein
MPKGWDATRARILTRDPICVLCHAAPATEVHHADPPREDDAALCGACAPCHLRATLGQASAARWADADARSAGAQDTRHDAHAAQASVGTSRAVGRWLA